MAKTLADFQNDVRKNVAAAVQTVIDEIGDLKAKDFHSVEGLNRYLDRLAKFVEILNTGTDVHVRLQDDGHQPSNCGRRHYETHAAIELPATEAKTGAAS
jgi:hypothetical protein